jgi:hypothetical protein
MRKKTNSRAAFAVDWSLGVELQPSGLVRL